MGLFDSLFGGARMSDPVRGSAQVVSCSANRGRGVYQNCHLQLVVQAEGVPARSVEQQTLVHRSRWPFPGMTLPATIDRANPANVRIEWDALPRPTTASTSAWTASNASRGCTPTAL